MPQHASSIDAIDAAHLLEAGVSLQPYKLMPPPREERGVGHCIRDKIDIGGGIHDTSPFTESAKRQIGTAVEEEALSLFDRHEYAQGLSLITDQCNSGEEMSPDERDRLAHMGAWAVVQAGEPSSVVKPFLHFAVGEVAKARCIMFIGISMYR